MLTLPTPQQLADAMYVGDPETESGQFGDHATIMFSISKTHQRSIGYHLEEIPQKLLQDAITIAIAGPCIAGYTKPREDSDHYIECTKIEVIGPRAKND